MGYSTEFEGNFTFKPKLTVEQISYLNNILGEDRKDHPEWEPFINDEFLRFIDLELTEDYKSLEWDCSEKTYNMKVIVETVLALLHNKWPELELHGTMIAQGSEIGDLSTIIAKGKIIDCEKITLF